MSDGECPKENVLHSESVSILKQINVDRMLMHMTTGASMRGQFDQLPFQCASNQWRNQRGGLGVQTPAPFPIRIEAVFFTAVKLTAIKYYNLSLTTRRTINSHNLRKTNHLGRGVRLLVW